MVRRVNVAGKVKNFLFGAAGKPSVNSAFKSVAIDPKPSDLSLNRLKEW